MTERRNRVPCWSWVFVCGSSARIASFTGSSSACAFCRLPSGAGSVDTASSFGWSTPIPRTTLASMSGLERGMRSRTWAGWPACFYLSRGESPYGMSSTPPRGSVTIFPSIAHRHASPLCKMVGLGRHFLASATFWTCHFAVMDSIEADDCQHWESCSRNKYRVASAYLA